MYIKDIAKAPSEVLALMIRGLQRQSERDTFCVAFQSFGSVLLDDNVCFGCAATCVIQEIAGKDFTPTVSIRMPDTRKVYLGIEDTIDAFTAFERAVDSIRRGTWSHLFAWYQISIRGHMDELNHIFMPLVINPMEDLTWRKLIPVVENIIIQLRRLGF